MDSLKWIADYFVQNHHSDLEFTGQIGNVDDDHSSWGRPENMTEDRPGFDLNVSAPGKMFCVNHNVTLAVAGDIRCCVLVGCSCTGLGAKGGLWCIEALKTAAYINS